MNYWEQEMPTVVDTGANVLRHFKQAGKLQVSLPSYIDKKSGELRQNKTVTVEVAALRHCEAAVALLTQLMTE